MINRYSIINAAKCLIEDGSQNYLTFQPLFKYFEEPIKTVIDATGMGWKSKRLSDESIKPPAVSDNGLTAIEETS